jgi:hypothetical protein
MTGDNQYDSPMGRQDALKGMRIRTLPPVCMLHLKRFEFDPATFSNVKLMTRYEYQERFDFGPWTEGKLSQPYRLFAVLVHEGTKAGSGHYYSFIHKEGAWLKFNDEVITRASRAAVFEDNFGGMARELSLNKNKLEIEHREVPLVAAAYMLIYVRESMWDECLRELDLEELPKELIQEEEEKIRQD